MTDSTGVIVISFLAAAGIICFFYVTKMANDLAAQIMTGTIDGQPISLSYRWLLLYQTWASCRSSDDFGQEAVLSKRRFMVFG
jgi:hypothetical protein